MKSTKNNIIIQPELIENCKIGYIEINYENFLNFNPAFSKKNYNSNIRYYDILLSIQDPDYNTIITQSYIYTICKLMSYISYIKLCKIIEVNIRFTIHTLRCGIYSPVFEIKYTNNTDEYIHYYPNSKNQALLTHNDYNCVINVQNHVNSYAPTQILVIGKLLSKNISFDSLVF